jgi:hypothetical protein
MEGFRFSSLALSLRACDPGFLPHIEDPGSDIGAEPRRSQHQLPVHGCGDLGRADGILAHLDPFDGVLPFRHVQGHGTACFVIVASVSTGSTSAQGVSTPSEPAATGTRRPFRPQGWRTRVSRPVLWTSRPSDTLVLDVRSSISLSFLEKRLMPPKDFKRLDPSGILPPCRNRVSAECTNSS